MRAVYTHYLIPTSQLSAYQQAADEFKYELFIVARAGEEFFPSEFGYKQIVPEGKVGIRIKRTGKRPFKSVSVRAREILAEK